MGFRIGIIGSGFAGLSSACVLASRGFQVTVFEKNEQPGGRAREFKSNGFTFDMGPSWYWMPDVFEDFFQRFGKTAASFYDLKRLDPSYQVFFTSNEKMVIPADISALKNLLESLEPGAANALDKFLAEAKVKYEAGMKKFVWKPSLSMMEYADVSLLRESFRLKMFSDMRTHLKKYFSHPQILQLLEFPVLFLGAKPEKTPALYSMMNYADIALGTWYPMGGMHRIVEAMVDIAKENGAVIHTNCEVKEIIVENGKATGIRTSSSEEKFDVIIGAGDYHHIEENLLSEKYRSYSSSYWKSRVMSPSSLLFYIGVNKKVDGLLHHNLFFDSSYDTHAAEIYDQPAWPVDPLFYVCCPSRTDRSIAPEGCENLFLLIPVAPDLTSDENMRNQYFEKCIARIESKTGCAFRENIVYKRSYAHEEFISDYHSYRGNAYGLANTLTQTAFLKPKMKSRKVKNLFYAGQLTVPGPGVPPSIISGQVAASEVAKYLQPRSQLIS